MRRRDLIVAGAALAAAPSLARSQAAPVKVKLTTQAGDIVVEVYPDKAPITAGNFLRYVDARRYDGAEFYRALKAVPDPPLGLIQGGFNGDPAKMYPPIKHEPTTQTGLRHVDGTLSLARFDPGSATSEFFIVVGDGSYLDADPNVPGDNLGFAAFGQTVEGMEVVKAILASPTSPTKGGADMKGQMLEPPIRILKAARVV